MTRPPVHRTFSGAPWEKQVGYCRAIRSGNHVYVTGTAPVGDDGQVVAPGDAAAQTERCLEIIDRALGELGASREDVVRTRLFVTDIERWAEIGRVHQAYFGEHPPATTMVEVSRLIDPAMLLEIEVDAHVLRAAPAAAEYLRQQKDVPELDLEGFPFDPNVVAMIPGEIAHKHRVIPLDRDGPTLRVVIANPKNMFGIDDVAFLTGYVIEIVVPTDLATLDEAIAMLYPTTHDESSN